MPCQLTPNKFKIGRSMDNTFVCVKFTYFTTKIIFAQRTEITGKGSSNEFMLLVILYFLNNSWSTRYN